MAQLPLLPLLLPARALAAVVTMLDTPSLRALRAVSRVLRAVAEAMARVAAGLYAVVDLAELDRSPAPKHPQRPPWTRAQAPAPFSPIELDLLWQLACLEAKFAVGRAGFETGALVVDEFVLKVLPPGFSAIVQRFALHAVRAAPERLHAALLGAARPALIEPRGSSDDEALMDEDDGENEGEGEGEGELEDLGEGEDLKEGMDEGTGPPPPSDRVAELIRIILGRGLSSEFYHLKQDALNSIVNLIENQYNFCRKVLRFGDADFAAHVAEEAGNVWLTPGRVRSLYGRGYCVVDNFLPPAAVEAVFRTCIQFVQQTAEVSALPKELLNNIRERPPFLMTRGDPPTARGDCLLWLNSDTPPGNAPPLLPVLQEFSRLFAEVGSVVQLTGGRESQLAFYPDKGEGYRRHRDAEPDDGERITDNRRITCICYCNPRWQPDHGGRLRLWLSHLPNAPVADLDPLPGRLFLFMSGLIDHEVRPSFNARVAVTNWFW